MTRTMLTLAVGAAIGMGGLTLAQTGHGHGKGPTVKTLSAVDVDGVQRDILDDIRAPRVLRIATPARSSATCWKASWNSRPGTRRPGN